MEKTILTFVACTLAAFTCTAARFGEGSDGDGAVAVFARTKRSLVLIKGSRAVGSGFVAKADGKTWLYTNEHVARGGSPLRAHFVDGRELEFKGTVEVAENRDVARAEVAAETPALEIAKGDPMLDQPVFVFGNSDGGGVMTKLDGKVVGVGDDQIEVDVKFVQGNSGSAILDGNGKVVGIATMARLNRDPENWVKLDTRFNEVRRYGERLCDIVWKQVDWKEYDRACRKLDAFEAYRAFLIPVCFKNKELATDYNVKDIKGVGSVGTLKDALAKLVRQDGEFLQAAKDLEATMEKRKRYSPGSIQYPSKEGVDMRYKKLQRELLESIVMRKNALRTAMRSLKRLSWPCRRQKDDAQKLYAGFKFCAEAYDEFNDDSLSQVDWKVD